jgi:hypothetical protein
MMEMMMATSEPAKIPTDFPPETPAAGPQMESGVSPDIAEELDEEEAEFRALRRDVPGVKGSSAAGISILVAKMPDKNEFFRTHPRFRPVVQMASLEQRMEKHFLAVTREMVEPLRGIGIGINDYTLYWTLTARGASRIIPVRQAMGDSEQNEFERSKEIGLLQGMTGWVRLYTDMENRCYQVFSAPADRYAEPEWPDLKDAKIFRLAFRDKGRLIDTVEHVQFKKWAARDTG